MRRVHWSLWGLLGFFGMLVVGLWIDSYWLPGVGVVAPGRVISAPVPIKPVQDRPATTSRDDEPDDDADSLPAGTTADWEDQQVTVGLSAPEIIGGGLEIPLDEPVELLPDPKTSEVLSDVDLPLDASAFKSMPLAIPVGPVGSEAPPARQPSASSEPTPANSAAGKAAPPLPTEIDDPDGQISTLLESLKPNGVMNSREFVPDAQSRAQYRREFAEAIRQMLEQDRTAALLDPPPPQRSPVDLLRPPEPPCPEPITSNVTSPEQVAALRSASRQLDEIANELERHGLYPRADEVRGFAQEMRIDARKGPQQRAPRASILSPGPYDPYENATPGVLPSAGN